MVKKIMNEPQNIVDEMLEGFVFAHEEIEWFPNYRVVALKEKKKGKVGIMSVGGSGHEPAHAGYVGKGMLDAAVAGNLFASPSPDQMLKAMEEINTGAGVLVVLKNYSGDLMNYSVAKELAQMKGIEVECVVVKDDVAVPDSTYSTGRRGIAGTIFVHKIAGAKANEGASLQEVKEAAEIANANIRSSAVAIMAAGQIYVMVSGGIDLSIPSVMMLSGCIGAYTMRETENIMLGVLAIMMIAILLGLFNGFSVAKIGINPFVATMITMIFSNGLSLRVTKSTSIPVLPKFTELFGKYYGPFHANIIMMLVCLIILQFLLTKTAFGRSIYAIGTNEKTAQACGIKTGKIKIQVFLISGIMAGLAAIALTARISSSSLSLASDGTSLDVIAAAIVGGASIKGGVGTVLGALIGAFIINGLSNLLVLFGIDYYTIQIIKGAVFIFITWFDTIRANARRV